MQDDLSFTTTVTDARAEKRYVILGPYRCKVHFPNGEYGIFGRGGIDALRGTTFYQKTDDTQPSLIVGNFCDFASNFTLLTGGEHYNDRVINAAFAHYPPAFAIPKQEGSEYRASYTRGPITLGSNVVVSSGVTIRSGVTVGDGAVLGAGCVVTKDVPPYAIMAGNPARLIRYRVPEEHIEALLEIAWWNWAPGFLARQMAAIHALSAADFIAHCHTLTPILPAHDDALLVFRLDRQGGQRSLQFQGAERSGRMIPLHQLPMAFLDYMGQLNAPAGATLQVRPDLFSLLDA